jgi:F-type H+-transporting ATPase subunit delta
MAEKATIARPYARAAFAHASEHKDLARWSELLSAASVVVSDERVAKLLSNPKVPPTELVELIVEAVGAAGPSEQGRNFLNTLAANRRLDLLPEISSIFEKLRAELENIADVQVTSAVELSAEQRERLASALKKRLKREVRLHCNVDASLLGGAIVRCDDLVIDGSLKARLERLAGQLVH